MRLGDERISYTKSLSQEVRRGGVLLLVVRWLGFHRAMPLTHLDYASTQPPQRHRQQVYKMQADAQHKIKVDSLQYKSREKTEKQRRLDYLEAQELVGDEKIEAMEVEMRDKLNQRTSTGPFQLRKTFKVKERLCRRRRRCHRRLRSPST